MIHREHPGISEPAGAEKVAAVIQHAMGTPWAILAHVCWFGVWMLAVEVDPWPTLTLIVSLEAIFLALFLLIGQNFAERRDHETMGADHHILQVLLAMQRDQNTHWGLPVPDGEP